MIKDVNIIREKFIEICENVDYQFSEDDIENIYFIEKEIITRGERKGEVLSVWVVAIDIPIFSSTDFFTFDAETSEPLYLQSKHLIREFGKDENGKYFKKPLE